MEPDLRAAAQRSWQSRASRLAPPRGAALPYELQRQISETATTLRSLLYLSSSSSAPVLLDPASVRGHKQPVVGGPPGAGAAWPEKRAGQPKTSPRLMLPPLDATSAPRHDLPGSAAQQPPLPPAAAAAPPAAVDDPAAVAAAAAAAATAETGATSTGTGLNRGGSFANLGAIDLLRPKAEAPRCDEPFEDWKEAQLFVACFWPLHVWRRETVKARTLAKAASARIADGISRLRAFRRWRKEAVARGVRKATARQIKARVRKMALRQVMARVQVVGTRDRKCREALANPSYARLRASWLARLPFLALRCYAACRARVRRRSVGEMMLRAEAAVTPLPVPPGWRPAPPLARLRLRPRRL